MENGKSGELELQNARNDWVLITKFGNRDYVGDITLYGKIQGDRHSAGVQCLFIVFLFCYP